MGQICFTKNHLQNGLCILHHYDPSTPFVVVNLLYKVGSKDENPKKTGFAHLFEHLMFEGTPQVPYFDGPLQEAGGENNAFTNNDYTNYYDIVPAVNAEIPFWLEADRMQHLHINQDSLELQKKVVVEEFKETIHNQPYGDAYHLLREMVYHQHPYRWPVIGRELNHIASARLEDVSSFFNYYYVPNNVILVVAGNIREKKVMKLSEKWFAGIAANPDLRHTSYQEAPQLEPRRQTVYRDVPHDAIYLAFQMPGRLEEGYYAADVLTDILAAGNTSMFYQALIKEQGIFSEIDAYISGSNETGMLVIEGKLSENKSAEEGEDAIWKILKKLSDSPIRAADLKKVKNKMITYLNFSNASLLNRAISLAYYEMLGDTALINEEERKYSAVRPGDIQDFCKRFIQPEQSNTLFYLREQN
jgi:predicted Zn-dependent peptidase